ncbi:MAG: alanine racemase [Betaproteobacteria bacterium]|nr:alanine racemase [Betaproteobacteria bacterium]
MTRPTCIHIQLDRLVHNFHLARQLHGGRVLAVVKANAYGHGDVACAQALAPFADGFAVASVQEALRLREAGVEHRIVLLEGIFGADEMEAVVSHRLTPVIHDFWQVDALQQIPSGTTIPAWLKLDTGMHRLGFMPETLLQAFEALKRSGRVSGITLMTHFANADVAVPGVLDDPLRRFRQAQQELPPMETSLCNSGALLGHPEAHGDWARPGLMLYGVDPAEPGIRARTPLQPVMRFVSEISAVRTIAAGESVGYGSRFKATRTTRVGVVPCGYADGYPRSTPDGTPVAVGEGIAPLIGCVSMDMITVDLTDLPAARVGTPVELWGDRVAVSTVASAAGTVAYELLCQARRAQIETHPATRS